jgi:hypothetical protein
MGYSQPQSSCDNDKNHQQSCDQDHQQSCDQDHQQSCDQDKSCQPSCGDSHSSYGGSSYGHSGDTTIGVAQGTGVNEQHGFVNVNALNGNNVLSNDLNGLHILSFG